MIDDSFLRGRNGEEEFILKAKLRGYDIVKAMVIEDMYKHYDLILMKDKGDYKVDVKGLKKKSRNGEFLIDEMWIEFTNVRGNHGWLYGEADWIAQQVATSTFYIFDRAELISQLNPLIQWNLPIVTSASQALYRLYQRPNRQDIITRVKLKDLKPLYIWE